MFPTRHKMFCARTVRTVCEGVGFSKDNNFIALIFMGEVPSYDDLCVTFTDPLSTVSSTNYTLLQVNESLDQTKVSTNSFYIKK